MGRPSILIVDDYVEGLEMWEMFFRLRGFDVLTSTNGMNALTLAETSHPDLVVLDLDLPEMNGREVAERLHAGASTAYIPIIAVTGCADERELTACREGAFEAVFSKPCDPDQLVTEVSRLLAMAR